MLETHLAEVKNQREPKIWHSKPLDHGRFLQPWSNKRTAGLPSPHPIDLQSNCSTPLGSPPLRLWQATAPCRIHTPPPGSLPLRPCQALPPHQIQPSWDPCFLGCSGSTFCQDPPSLRSPASQALLAPSSMWDKQNDALPGSPPLRARHQLGRRQPHPTAHQDPCPLDGAMPQLYRFPDNRTTELPLGLH
jgi:hypothetical protein